MIGSDMGSGGNQRTNKLAKERERILKEAEDQKKRLETETLSKVEKVKEVDTAKKP